MRPGLQIRLWHAQAIAGERRVAQGLIALAMTLLVGSVVVSPDALTPGSPSTGTTGQIGRVVDGPASAAPEPAGAADKDLGDGAGRSTVAQRYVAPIGLSPTTTRGPEQSLPAGRRASDRGVDVATVTIGFLVEQGPLDPAGPAVGSIDMGALADALVSYVNARGGIGGRRVVGAVHGVDPLDPAAQMAACESMAIEREVFGVVAGGVVDEPSASRCIARDQQLPFVHTRLWGTAWLERSKGLEVGYPAAIDRISRAWVRDLAVSGWMPDGGVLGILADTCEATEPVVDDVLAPLARTAGPAKVVVEKRTCDTASVLSQTPSIVARLKAAGVSHVLLASDEDANAVFMSVARAQGFSPRYSVSDWHHLAGDPSASRYPADQFDGAVAITSNRLLAGSPGPDPQSAWAHCAAAATAAGLPALQYAASHQEAIAICDSFFLMVDALAAAGPNPTRWTWAAAVQRLGEHPSALFGPSRMAPGKTTGSDTVMTAVWAAGCRCFQVAGASRPAPRSV